MTFKKHLIELRENLISVIRAPEFEKESRPMQNAYRKALENVLILERSLTMLAIELDRDPDVIKHRKNVDKN